MSSEELEPDAYMRPTTGQRLAPDFSEHKNHRNWRGFEDEVEALYSAETIKQLIKDKRKELNNGRTNKDPMKDLTELLEEVDQS
jgi:hypothetical protein